MLLRILLTDFWSRLSLFRFTKSVRPVIGRPSKRAHVERLESRSLLAAKVLINEIHYDPDIKTEQVEFIELQNSGDTVADLAGWSFADGISYTFEQGVAVPPDGFVVVAQDPDAFARKFGVAALGPFSGKLSNDGERIELVNANGESQDEVSYRLGFPWPTVGAAPGNSIELANPQSDNDLAGSWRSSSGQPTPGAANSRLTENVAPRMRQVKHDPQQPTSHDDVKVSIKVTDPDGVSQVTLGYQIVVPGDYIAIDDPRYESGWTTIAMRDDGQEADAIADDDVYSTILSSNLQQHRHLVRYRITAMDRHGASITGPYDDDPVPNFAYYVYDGFPAWRASAGPNDDPVTFDSQLLESIQTYQLITTRDDHVNSQQLPGSTEPAYEGREYRWKGTIVAGGEVYDHIRFRARGGTNRFARGKNAWKFDFNRGQPFAAIDDFGKAYTAKWDKLNLAHIANTSFRGEHGMVEALSYRMFNLAGVESPRTHFIQFRIVESAEENPVDQYRSDFQGLYLVAEQPDGRFLDEHDLPDGNFYKIEQGLDAPGSLNNQGPLQPSDSSDLIEFVNGYTNRPDEQWWRDHLDLEKYYSYRSIVEAVRHYDIAGTNQFYFHHPETDKWSVHAWDVDLTWRSQSVFGNGSDALAPRLFRRNDALIMEYHNRLREIIDLLFNHDQTDMLIDETAQFIYTSGQLSLVDADRAMWDHNPIIAAARFGGTGQFYASTPTGDFAGMLQGFRDFIDTRTSFIDRRILRGDDALPDTPSLTYLGDADFALNRLRFRTSEFRTPTEQPFGAVQWRIAEVTDTSSNEFDSREPRKYEIDAAWQSEPILDFNDTMVIPSGHLSPDKTYRVRVRMRDAVGYWSRWSEPVQFVTRPGIGDLIEGLRVTEINYHPKDPEPESPFEDEDFEFIEFQNVSGQTIDLAGVSLEDGVRMTLPLDGPIELSPDQRMLVVANRAAFESRYGTTHRIAGQYSGRLSNGGDRIVVKNAAGETIQDFSYDDENGWPEDADGGGPTLEIIDAFGDYNDHRNWRASQLAGGSPGTPARIPGDANGDGVFNSADLITAFQAGEYEDNIEDNSTFDEGDWNDDGDFTSRDIVFAFQSGTFTKDALPLVWREWVGSSLEKKLRFRLRNRSDTGAT